VKAVRAVVIVALAAAACLTATSSTAATASATTKACPAATKHGVRVIRLQRTLGCTTALTLAIRAVNDHGYYQDSRYYCRWGQGGTRPIRVNGRSYFAGFCYRKRDEKEASFLARRLR
jgi:hypothetical protein